MRLKVAQQTFSNATALPIKAFSVQKRASKRGETSAVLVAQVKLIVVQNHNESRLFDRVK